jgi:hypothetical protein
MLKLTIAVLALALAGTASAAGWRSLRVDATSEASFAESVAAIQKKLSPSRRYAFSLALQDIWLKGQQDAEAARRDYTATDYHRQVHGLGYNEVVTLLDPSGRSAHVWRSRFYGRNQGARSSFNLFNERSRWTSFPVPTGANGETERGRTGMAGF